MATVAVQGISQTFMRPDGSFHEVLKHMDLSIDDGQIVTVVGSSGCGKSTLLNVIAGFLEPTSGSILVDKIPRSGPGPDRGMVFQQDTLFGWRTVLRNVEYGLENKGVPRPERRAQALAWIERVGLADYSAYLPKQLSIGMKKRVQIAAVLANSPDVLLMDEPYGALDYPTKCRLQDELLSALSAIPKTTVFVTHDLEEAIYLADRVIVISAGQIVEDLAINFPRPRRDELRTSSQLTQLKAHLWDSIGYGAQINHRDLS